VLLHQFTNNVFFDFFDLFNTRVGQCGIDFEPIFSEFGASVGLGVEVAGYEDNLEFASVEVVTNDDLVAVALECDASFGYQEFGVRF